MKISEAKEAGIPIYKDGFKCHVCGNANVPEYQRWSDENDKDICSVCTFKQTIKNLDGSEINWVAGEQGGLEIAK